MIHWSVDKLYSSLNMLTDCGFHLHCQLECVWNHLKDIPLEASMRMLPERFNGGGATHPECGQHHPMELIKTAQRRKPGDGQHPPRSVSWSSGMWASSYHPTESRVEARAWGHPWTGGPRMLPSGDVAGRHGDRWTGQLRMCLRLPL